MKKISDKISDKKFIAGENLKAGDYCIISHDKKIIKSNFALVLNPYIVTHHISKGTLCTINNNIVRKSVPEIKISKNLLSNLAKIAHQKLKMVLFRGRN